MRLSVFALVCLFLTACATREKGRERISFNKEWRFALTEKQANASAPDTDDSNWRVLNLPQNVFLVGTRSLDEGEQALIEREQLSVYTMDMIHLKGIGFVAEDIKRKLKERKIRNVHFSIDVDSIDPRFAPGTGTRVCEGLMPDEFKDFVEHILFTNLIKSMDLVELNSELDVNDQTTNLCLDIIDYITARL